eukprot:sb/3474360/
MNYYEIEATEYSVRFGSVRWFGVFSAVRFGSLIPSLMCSQGSLLTPQKTLNSGQRCNTLISGWAWYLRFQPEARTISTLKIGVEIKEGIKVISVLALVGVGAGITLLYKIKNKLLSNLQLRYRKITPPRITSAKIKQK